MHPSQLASMILVWLVFVAAPPVRAAEEADPPPAVAARFELRVTPATGETPPPRTWLLWREPDRVETRLPTGIGERWRRDARGDVYYQRLFHEPRRLIEYAPVDLRALGTTPDWARLAHLIDPALLGNELKRVETTTAFGRAAVRYRGRVQGTHHEVLWLVRERLPARMRVRYDDRAVTVRLKAIHPIERSPWPRANIDTYRITDYADIGDDEADPFLRRLLNDAEPARAHPLPSVATG